MLFSTPSTSFSSSPITSPTPSPSFPSPPSHFQREYIDLISRGSSRGSSRGVNWDLSIPVEVGAFGQVDSETGELQVEGNIYDTDFQAKLNRLGLSLHMADHLPQETGDGDAKFIVASKGGKRVELSVRPEADFAELGTAFIKDQWRFKAGKRHALLIMHRPRLRFLPPDVVLDRLYKVPMLKDKWLVTSVHVCPALFMYLSGKSGEKVSLALIEAPTASAVAGGPSGLNWWVATPTDPPLLRTACHKAGEYAYTPLYTMEKRRTIWAQTFFR